MASFEGFEVWTRAVQLSIELNRDLGEPRDYGFRDQVTKADLSVPSNIAESMKRESKADKLRVLRISRGSCGELRMRIQIGMEIDCIDRKTGQHWMQGTREISAMLVGLIRSIERGG